MQKGLSQLVAHFSGWSSNENAQSLRTHTHIFVYIYIHTCFHMTIFHGRVGQLFVNMVASHTALAPNKSWFAMIPGTNEEL